MGMTNEQASACLSCISDNKGIPPCLGPNRLAHAKGHPIVTFVSIASTTVKWPCYFHADWHDLAPLVIGRLPDGDSKHPDHEGFHQSDLRMTGNPNDQSPMFLKLMKDGLGSLVGSRSSDAVTYARSDWGMKQAGYQTSGNRSLYLGQYEVLYSSHRDNRFQNWLKALERYNRNKVPMLPLTESAWDFTTYGSAGVLGFNGGHIVLKSLQDASVDLHYVGYGASVSPLPKIALNKLSPKGLARLDKFKKYQGSYGPTNFDTHGMVLKSTISYSGTAEPTLSDLTGLCLIASVSAAAGIGYEGSGPSLGIGGDVSVVMRLPTFNVVFAMYGKGAGLSLPSGGIYIGYIGQG